MRAPRRNHPVQTDAPRHRRIPPTGGNHRGPGVPRPRGSGSGPVLPGGVGGAGAAPAGPGRRRRATRDHLVAMRVMVVVGVALTVGVAALFLPGAPLALSGDRGTVDAQADPDPSDPEAPSAAPTPTPTPSPTPPALPFRSATVVTPQGVSFFSWSLMDRRTGQLWGSTNQTATTWPASMSKGWLAADFLRRATESKQTPAQDRINQITAMIRDSDNNAAEDIFNALGRNASITRLLSVCKFTDSRVDSRGWGFVNISARDAVRMADCIADGTAAGPQWTDFLMGLMRTVREGNWGIRDALQPADASKVAIKNGWLDYEDDGNWHVNCMAVGGDWAMTVLQRYPISGPHKGESFGAQNCEAVATQLLNPAYVVG